MCRGFEAINLCHSVVSCCGRGGGCTKERGVEQESVFLISLKSTGLLISQIPCLTTADSITQESTLVRIVKCIESLRSLFPSSSCLFRFRCLVISGFKDGRVNYDMKIFCTVVTLQHLAVSADYSLQTLPKT